MQFTNQTLTTKISSKQLSRVLIECQQPAKKPDTWRSELSTFGEKWVKGGSEGFKLPRGSAVTSVAKPHIYLNILGVYFKT